MTDQITLSAEWLADVRLRAEQSMDLCLCEHTVHRSDDETVLWITCDDPTGERDLGSFVIPESSFDQTEAIRYFVASARAKHERAVAADVVLTLLAALGV